MSISGQFGQAKRLFTRFAGNQLLTPKTDLALKTFIASCPDFMRTNQYRVHFPMLPLSIQNLGLSADLSLLCKSATFPFFTTETEEYYRGNINVKMINGVTYEPITIEFYVDQSMLTLAVFFRWLQAIRYQEPLGMAGYHQQGGQYVTQGHQNLNNTIGYKEDYVGIIAITILDSKGSEKATAYLINAYPTNMANIELAYGEGEIMSVQVNFEYDAILYELVALDQTAESLYTAYNIASTAVYKRFYLMNFGAPLEDLRNSIGNYMGQENLYRMEKKAISQRTRSNLEKNINGLNSTSNKVEQTAGLAGKISTLVI